MALVDTKLGLIDDRYLELRTSVIDDETRYGVRVEVFAKPADQLAKMAVVFGDEAHPNCGAGEAREVSFLADTVDGSGQLGAGTMVVTRDETHPPNCIVNRLIREQRETPIAVYELVDWTKGNPFEADPEMIEVAAEDGAIVVVPSSSLTKTLTLTDNANEYTYVAEWHDASGRSVKRAPNVKLRRPSVTASSELASF